MDKREKEFWEDFKNTCVTRPPLKMGNTNYTYILNLDAFCNCCKRFYKDMPEWQAELKKQNEINNG